MSREGLILMHLPLGGVDLNATSPGVLVVKGYYGATDVDVKGGVDLDAPSPDVVAVKGCYGATDVDVKGGVLILTHLPLVEGLLLLRRAPPSLAVLVLLLELVPQDRPPRVPQKEHQPGHVRLHPPPVRCVLRKCEVPHHGRDAQVRALLAHLRELKEGALRREPAGLHVVHPREVLRAEELVHAPPVEGVPVL
eukprot:1195616-Prorocentrum_minimum.AAC.4